MFWQQISINSTDLGLCLSHLRLILWWCVCCCCWRYTEAILSDLIKCRWLVGPRPGDWFVIALVSMPCKYLPSPNWSDLSWGVNTVVLAFLVLLLLWNCLFPIFTPVVAAPLTWWLAMNLPNSSVILNGAIFALAKGLLLQGRRWWWMCLGLYGPCLPFLALGAIPPFKNWVVLYSCCWTWMVWDHLEILI